MRRRAHGVNALLVYDQEDQRAKFTGMMEVGKNKIWLTGKSTFLSVKEHPSYQPVCLPVYNRVRVIQGAFKNEWWTEGGERLHPAICKVLDGHMRVHEGEEERGPNMREVVATQHNGS